MHHASIDTQNIGCTRRAYVAGRTRVDVRCQIGSKAGWNGNGCIHTARRATYYIGSWARAHHPGGGCSLLLVRTASVPWRPREARPAPTSGTRPGLWLVSELHIILFLCFFAWQRVCTASRSKAFGTHNSPALHMHACSFASASSPVYFLYAIHIYISTC